MANVRLVTVIRKDLDLTEGMLAAQSLHVGDQWARTKIIDGTKFTKLQKEWCAEPYVAVLHVNNGEELEVIRKRAVDAGVEVSEWSDLLNSRVLKGGYRAEVGISLGPADADELKEVTGNLPLF